MLAYLDGPAADLAFRRGWTHGIPALVVLPFLLTGAVICFDRIVRRMGRAVLPSGVLPREVLLLAVIAILTHPLLDTLNTYGVRWLMPVRGDWYYGDTLFIVDPWLWLVLAVGVVASNGRRSARGLKTGAAAPRESRWRSARRTWRRWCSPGWPRGASRGGSSRRSAARPSSG